MAKNSTKSPSPRALKAAAVAAAEERATGAAPAQKTPVPGVEDQSLVRDDVDLEADGAGETVTLVQHVCTVSNDPATKVPTEVYDHEVAVLEAIHGVGNVEIVDGRSEEVDVENFTPEAEYDRLLRKYVTKNEPKVRGVYGSPNQLAAELGFKPKARVGTTAKRQQAQSIAVDRRVKRKVSTKTAKR